MAAQFRSISYPDNRAVTPDVIEPVAAIFLLCANHITTRLMHPTETAIPTEPVTLIRILRGNLILKQVRVTNRLTRIHQGILEILHCVTRRGDDGVGVRGRNT